MYYTRTGDGGVTSTYRGARISKDDLEIEVYGTFDELLSYLGYVYSKIEIDTIRRDLVKIMNDIHNLLSDIGKNEYRISESSVRWLEQRIEEYGKILKPIKTFVLEVSNEQSALVNISRAVARRAERRLVALSKERHINEHVLSYTNRLSDYLFTLFRYLNAVGDVNELRYVKYEEEKEY